MTIQEINIHFSLSDIFPHSKNAACAFHEKEFSRFHSYLIPSWVYCIGEAERTHAVFRQPFFQTAGILFNHLTAQFVGSVKHHFYAGHGIGGERHIAALNIGFFFIDNMQIQAHFV